MTMQSRYLLGMAALASLMAAGCHIDMWEQPKVKAFYESDFYPDRQGSRPLVEGTIARGNLNSDDTYHTGMVGTKPVAQIPVEAVKAFGGPKAMLDRGENRYHVYCSPCHGALGNGNGFIAQRGMGFWQKMPATLLQKRLVTAPDGYLYDVLTHGKGAMYGYASRIQLVEDRWAVVAYMRTLQEAAKESGNSAPVTAPASGTTPDAKEGEVSHE